MEPRARGAAHPRSTRTGEWLPGHLAPVAARIVGTIRDYDLDDVHQIVAKVPDEKRTDLILLLAAMVDPDQTPADLLEWTTRPAQSRDGLERPGTVAVSAGRVACPDCGKTVRTDHLKRHRGGNRCRPERRAA
jgi:hypothetical protein